MLCIEEMTPFSRVARSAVSQNKIGAKKNGKLGSGNESGNKRNGKLANKNGNGSTGNGRLGSENMSENSKNGANGCRPRLIDWKKFYATKNSTWID